MSDVARLAGVSHQTVSRVLNDSPNVRPQTRDRVLAAIGELGYRPNRLARALATRGFRSVGVLTTDTLAHGPASTLLGIERATRGRGWAVTVASPATTTGEATRAAIEHLLDQGCGGLLVIAPHDAAVKALPAVGDGVPVVWVAGPEHAGLPVVRVDQAAGAVLATRHLLDAGHRTVHHLAGPDAWDEARERRAGWAGVLRQAGAPVPPPLVGDWSAGSGYAAGRTLAGDPGVTAVFAGNDEMAIGVLRALAEAGRRVPDDVAVVGFDDLPVSSQTIPPLTTVRQDFDDLGRRAVDRLAGLLGPAGEGPDDGGPDDGGPDDGGPDDGGPDDGGPETGTGPAGRRPAAWPTLAPQLVVRASTGPVR